ncbi:MAG: hypothetical protein QOI08_3833, partial [Actinomycetota bacterium]|nr:hypothetical protein [Actinomycetota bacterium]
ASDQRPASRLPGATRGPGTEVFTQTFQLSAIDAQWLPAAYRPIRIDLPGSQVLPGSTSLFLEQALTGITYRVQSEISNPDKTILESVTFDDLRTMTDDVQLPPNFSGNARELAHTVTARAVTPYDKALALMQFFQSDPFIYDQSVDLGANAHALDQFLFKTHRGFCEQYSAAFAELARSIGLPTRVAVGYQRGTLGADGRWHVAEKDAHAWPEVWLGPTVGWYRFEPTPGRLDPVTGLGTAPRGPAAPTTTTPTTTAGPTTPTTASGTATSIPPLGIQTIQPPPPKSSSNTRGHVVTVILVVIASALLASLAFVAFLAYSAWLRTRRRRRDPDDRRRVLGAWTEALERLAAAGIIRRPATTSLEFALRQAPALGAGAAGPPLMDLARLHTAAMYSPDPPTPDDADTAWTEVDAIATALRATVPRTRRLRARWWSAARRTKPTSADDADSDDSEEDDLSPQR